MTRIAVVTGSCGGIGAATVRRLRATGWHVVGVDRADTDDESDEHVTLDLAELDAVETAAMAIAADHPTIHALVNNAAEQHAAPIAEISAEMFLRTLTVNVASAHVMVRALAPALTAAEGAVVNVASVHAHASTPQMSAYAASKAALCGYTRVAALELAPRVRVNAVLPGAVDTSMLRAGLSRRPEDGPAPQALAALAERTPLQRIGAPDDIAAVIAALVDPEASRFVTGQEIVADGGVLARLPSE